MAGRIPSAHVRLMSSVEEASLGPRRSASTASSRSVAMSRLSTKASAPARSTASRTHCSSWTLRTITLRSGQSCRSACNQFRPLLPRQGEIHDRHVGLEAARAFDQRRVVGHHDHRSECGREQPAHAFGETVVAVRQQHTAQRLLPQGHLRSANHVCRDACLAPCFECSIGGLRSAVTSKDYVAQRPESTGLRGRSVNARRGRA